ncbi:MAG TPA: MotA/TolQ/ExbB proton channel family protein [Symbiobacteriaceae bacterium]
MELATLIGLALFIPFWFFLSLEHIRLPWLLSVSAFGLVASGTLISVFFAHPMAAIRRLPGALRAAIRGEPPEAKAVIAEVVRLNERVRKDGLSALAAGGEKSGNALLQHGARLAASGAAPEALGSAMKARAESEEQGVQRSAAVLETAGRYAPMAGLISTIIALIVILTDFSRPDSLGPKVAVGLLTSLYGLAAAYLFCLPLAAKIRHTASGRALCARLATDGLLAICRGEATDHLEMRLREQLDEYLLEQG